MSLIRNVVSRVAGGAGAARRGRPVGGRPMGGGGMGRGTGRTQDEAIGRGVRSLLRRKR